MKYRIAFLLAIVTIFVSFFPFHVTVKHAESDIESLTPNSYQKRDFRENTNFLRENNLNEHRESVPDEQKLITFKQREKKAEEDFIGSLFTTDEEKSTTIQITSAELKLFTQQDTSRHPAIVNTESYSKTNSIIILLYGFLAIAVILLLVLILPRMAKGEK